jgi:hypothetical protein
MKKFKDISVKDLVKDKMVSYEYYRGGELWYKTTDGFMFPVPISDVGDATFMKEDRAITFMRYIRKYHEELIKNDASYITEDNV